VPEIRDEVRGVEEDLRPGQREGAGDLREHVVEADEDPDARRPAGEVRHREAEVPRPEDVLLVHEEVGLPVAEQHPVPVHEDGGVVERPLGPLRDAETDGGRELPGQVDERPRGRPVRHRLRERRGLVAVEEPVSGGDELGQDDEVGGMLAGDRRRPLHVSPRLAELRGDLDHRSAHRHRVSDSKGDGSPAAERGGAGRAQRGL
jgi:hypothetical protein